MQWADLLHLLQTSTERRNGLLHYQRAIQQHRSSLLDPREKGALVLVGSQPRSRQDLRHLRGTVGKHLGC